MHSIGNKHTITHAAGELEKKSERVGIERGEKKNHSAKMKRFKIYISKYGFML